MTNDNEIESAEIIFGDKRQKIDMELAADLGMEFATAFATAQLHDDVEFGVHLLVVVAMEFNTPPDITQLALEAFRNAYRCSDHLAEMRAAARLLQARESN